MSRKLVTHTVESTADARSFFDRCAPAYAEQHGDAERLFKYRTALIKQHARFSKTDVLLDLACGTGEHLLALASDIAQGIGVDLSPGMIEVAEQKLAASFYSSKLDFRVDNGEELATLADNSIDVAICVGAFEHMLDKQAVLSQVYRVLEPAGRFFCLTLNGDYIWYKRLAPLVGLETRHLSTDRFLTKTEFVQMLSKAGFKKIRAGYWTFIPKGDMPAAVGTLLAGMDLMGQALGINSLRGGLLVCAEKEERL
ncbi:MAG TPA: methyltransferase domain-containing protein [Pyrinomonadaceae bacterium]|jgi:2-polyprenyl-6-hydroxyphenyl methylase/3-demethylubiquinone-9 3-methyltransferase